MRVHPHASVQGDVHPHVKVCPKSRRPGEYFASLEEFNVVHNERRQREVNAYLDRIMDKEIRERVIKQCRRSLEDLKIRVRY